MVIVQKTFGVNNVMKGSAKTVVLFYFVTTSVVTKLTVWSAAWTTICLSGL